MRRRLREEVETGVDDLAKGDHVVLRVRAELRSL